MCESRSLLFVSEQVYLKVFEGAKEVKNGSTDYAFLDQLSYEYCLPKGFTSAQDFFDYLKGPCEKKSFYDEDEFPRVVEDRRHVFHRSIRKDFDQAYDLSRYFGGDESCRVYEVLENEQRSDNEVHGDDSDDTGDSDESQEQEKLRRNDIFANSKKKRSGWLVATESYGDKLHPLLVKWFIFDKQTKMYRLQAKRVYNHRNKLGPLGNSTIGMHRGNFQALFVPVADKKARAEVPLTLYRWMVKEERNLPIPCCDLPPDAKMDRSFPKIGTTLVHRVKPKSNCICYIRCKGRQKEYETADRSAQHQVDVDDSEGSDGSDISESNNWSSSEQDYTDERSYEHVYYHDPAISFNAGFYVDRLHGYPETESKRAHAQQQFDYKMKELQARKNVLKAKLNDTNKNIENIQAKMYDLQLEFAKKKATSEQEAKRRKHERDEKRKQEGKKDEILDWLHELHNNSLFSLEDPKFKLISLQNGAQRLQEMIARFDREICDLTHIHRQESRPKPAWGRSGLNRLQSFLEKDAKVKNSMSMTFYGPGRTLMTHAQYDSARARTTYAQYLQRLGACTGAITSAHDLWFKEYPDEEREIEEVYYTNQIWHRKLQRSCPYFQVGKLAPIVLIQRAWRAYAFRPGGSHFHEAKMEFEQAAMGLAASTLD